MKRSWKTSLGGGLAAVGTFLWGAPVAMSVLKVEGLPPELNKWCVIIGLVMSAGGVLFNGVFGRDNDVRSDEVPSIQKRSETNDKTPPVNLT